ncbi:MAG: FHA domain-containing protein [Deltaproteobacteria bacterium]|nr:FHA domain-containing protein [Deltaproteobacteria bacterium]
MNTQMDSYNSSLSENRLVGWLVSYGLDDLGVAYEIRTGRSFISNKQSSQARMLAVVDSSISSPHLALKASARNKVMVQDIFSDHGSFITRADNNREYPITGPTEIKHGDWVRVGQNVRFQVCIIDGSGR